MYNRYYTSSDVKVYFTNSRSTRIINVDTSLGINYSLRQTSSPIYSLGSREIQFYSHGNTIGSGSLVLAFTDEEYLKYCLDYVASDSISTTYGDLDTGLSNDVITSQFDMGKYTSKRIGNQPNEVLRQMEKANFIPASEVEGEQRLISIGAIRPLFDILIYINNETVIHGSDSKIIRLAGCKIITDSSGSNSLQDSANMVSYNFMFKDILRG